MKGLKACLRQTYSAVTKDLFDTHNAPQWKPLLYNLAFLHTVIQERKKFGAIGWNIPYEFNMADFTSSAMYLLNYFEDADLRKGVSWNSIRYMLGEIQYGGRVTDNCDNRLLNSYMQTWFGEHIMDKSFQYFNGYKLPSFKTMSEYRAYIDNLPSVDRPEVFGLHGNADLLYQSNTAGSMLSCILNIQPKTVSTSSSAGKKDEGGKEVESRENTVKELVDSMLKKMPEEYNEHLLSEQLQKLGVIQPMTIFLKQEVMRMKKLLSSIHVTLNNLQLAIEGSICMSDELQNILDSLYDAIVPHGWVKGFLTATLQEIARKHSGWSLDNVSIVCEVSKVFKEDVSMVPNEDLNHVIVAAGGFDQSTKAISASGVLSNLLFANHKEANTGILLHAKDATNNGYSRTVVQCKDKDVLVMLVNLCHESHADEVWISEGTSSQKIFVPVHTIFSSMPIDVRQSLIGFHSITGCDTTSQPNGISKKTAWEFYKKS
ncbi:hypothetical protein HELRODRAFT_162497 [Helobdella robusta]|uniref:Dynein heavy chain AAA lid domain-containing protein n=1 Tax=Helobdella robusta TaxID=6412 RepID=T1ESR1_HELRO|nr:hypothetical protein HELRODRAFT_162497 [Helobdella robusta]ESN99019.1 hypothetical protein HELRODRAFT_162497 [Helobdella robusta]